MHGAGPTVSVRRQTGRQGTDRRRRTRLVTVVVLVVLSIVMARSGAVADADGTISGTIGYPAGDQQSGTCVDAWTPDNEWQEGPFTTSYSISLPPGSYTLDFDPTCTIPEGLPNWAGPVGQWYDATATGAQDQEDAVAVAVTAGGTTSDINVVLAPSGHITGVVTWPPPSPSYEGPWTATSIQAFTSDGNWDGAIGDIQQPSTGYYTIGDLSAGPHYVAFFWQCDAVTNCPEGHVLWYPGVSQESQAELVDVGAGTTTTGIDISFAPLPTPSPTTTVAPAVPIVGPSTGPSGTSGTGVSGSSTNPVTTAPPTRASVAAAPASSVASPGSSTTAPSADDGRPGGSPDAGTAGGATGTKRPTTRLEAVSVSASGREGDLVWLWLLVLPTVVAVGALGRARRRRVTAAS